MGDITAANSVFTIVAAPIFPVPIQLQGYATDDAFTAEAVDMAETMMGVDGVKSAGALPFITPMRIMLQADSASIALIEALVAAQNANVFGGPQVLLFGSISLPSIGFNYLLPNGTIKRWIPVTIAKKVLHPRELTIDWGWPIVPTPIPVLVI